MMLSTTPHRVARRSAFTLLEVLVVVAILVILATVASIAVTRNLDDARKSKAQLQAKAIASAMEQYYINQNSQNQYPTTLQELVTPPWGGTSFLNDPQADMTDPWGQQFQIQQSQATDGSLAGKPLVYTKAPDGVPISQHGVGPASRLQ
ncbi:MAG: type II secretion system protein GspG [Gemmataceae bacterium]